MERGAAFGPEPGVRLRGSLCGAMQAVLVPALRIYSASRISTRRCAGFGSRFHAPPDERKTLSRVDRSKGKFRSFLLASLQNYLSNEAERARCLKRGGKAEMAYLDIEGAEDRY